MDVVAMLEYAICNFQLHTNIFIHSLTLHSLLSPLFHTFFFLTYSLPHFLDHRSQSHLTMPTLKQLSCQIEWAGSSVPFKEYGTAYGDGYVESYIAIPNSSTPFSINLRSNGYIAPGLAMFVFMDGVYQCNRNRDDLRPLARPSEAARKFRDIGFRVRQREERLPDGSWVGRPWRFERFQLGMSKDI